MSAKNGKYKNCTICGKEYHIRADRADKSKYCSRACWAKRRTLVNCQKCGGPITSYHAKKYCSKECANSDMIGEKAPRWKDGKSMERDRARESKRLKEWRTKVFTRDNYTCRHCGIGFKLHVHHIAEWAKDESKRFDVGNGLTLCIDCHGKVHGKDFSNRDKKLCPDCGKKIKRESNRCRRCSAINQWERQKNIAK